MHVNAGLRFPDDFMGTTQQHSFQAPQAGPEPGQRPMQPTLQQAVPSFSLQQQPMYPHPEIALRNLADAAAAAQLSPGPPARHSGDATAAPPAATAVSAYYTFSSGMQNGPSTQAQQEKEWEQEQEQHLGNKQHQAQQPQQQQQHDDDEVIAAEHNEVLTLMTAYTLACNKLVM